MQQYYTTQPSLYVYDLAVSTAHQRQGIGKMLMQGAVEYAKKSGFEEVFVQAELEDDHALDFYRATKAVESSAVHFTYFLC